jgi:hypothetical protein
MNKKASLSLSINAIVILVLAITMLGLGLAFTKGMFGKLSQKLSVPEPDIPATAEDTIVLPTGDLTITKNKEFIFSVNVYNDDFTGEVTGTLRCPADATTGAGEVMVASSPQEIPPGEDKGFKFIVPKTVVTVASTRICTLSFAGATSGTETKQVVISIK